MASAQLSAAACWEAPGASHLLAATRFKRWLRRISPRSTVLNSLSGQSLTRAFLRQTQLSSPISPQRIDPDLLERQRALPVHRMGAFFAPAFGLPQANPVGGA